MIEPTQQATQQSSQGDSPAAPASSTAPASAAASPSTQATPTADRPAGLPDAFWDDKSGLKTADLVKSFAELSTFKKAADERLALVPESADKYESALPKDFKLPDGWQVQPDDPMWKAGKEFAKANGLTQDQLSGLAKVWVESKIASEAANEAALAEGIKARDAALGANGAARVQALNNWFTAAFGEQIGKQLQTTLFTPDIVSAFEKIQLGLTSQGLTTFNQQGRSIGRTDGKPEDWDKWDPRTQRTWQIEQSMKRA